MKKNVIILTHGLTGSSVLTALISKAGYWYGDQTHRKIKYNTYENTRLIELNNRMLNELGYTGNREHEIVTFELVEDLEKKSASLDLEPYKAFIETCQNNRPWIWKDPRLVLTIRIWAKILPLDETAFIILTRENEQSWIACNLHRHIRSKAYVREYNQATTNTLKRLLDEKNKGYLEFEFEDIQLRPEETIEKLNKFLEIQLTMEDLISIYKLPLYKKSKNIKDKLTAWLVYLKNYQYRDDRVYKK